jgi:hypothetical protein
MLFRLAIVVGLISCVTREYNPCHTNPHKYFLSESKDTVIIRNKRERFSEMIVHKCMVYCCGRRDTFYLYKDLLVNVH